MIEENEVFLKALDDVFSEKTDEYINSLSDDGYEYSESFRLSTQKIIRNHSRPHNRILRSAVKYAACAAVLVFSCGVFSNIQKTDTQIFVSEMAVSETEPTEAATTAIAEMELEAPRTTAPVTTAAQTKPPEKRETTTVTTTVTTSETVKHTEAAPIVTTASSEKTEVQTETTTETTAQTTEKQTETTAEKQPQIEECEMILRESSNENVMPDLNYVYFLIRYIAEYEHSEIADIDYNTQNIINIADNL